MSVYESKRARLVAAMVDVAYARGYAGASVSSVCARAGVSRRTFYEVFDSLQDCFLAVLDEGARQSDALISQAFDREQTWLDGVRGALVALLSAFDSQPRFAYVVLVEAAAAGGWARDCRERHIASHTTLIEGRWGEPKDGHAHPHATAGVMASLLGVLHTHLVTGREEPLMSLLGSLMGLVTAPYLDQRLVAREIERADALARELLVRGERARAGLTVAEVQIPALLCNPRAHRARACLLYVAEHPGVSNRQIAQGVGIARRTQVSTLLSHLTGIGLLHKRSGAPGAANAWSLTSYGLRVAHVLKQAHESRLGRERQTLTLTALADLSFDKKTGQFSKRGNARM